MKNLPVKEKYHINFCNSDDVAKLVEDLKYKHLSLWWETRSDFPRLKEKTDFFQKLSNERKVEEFRKNLQKEVKSVPRDEGEIAQWSKKNIIPNKATRK